MGRPILLNGTASTVDTHEIVSYSSYPVSTTSGLAPQNLTPGDIGYLSCGRIFRWCYSATSATAAAGKTMSNPAIVANHQNLATTTTSLAVGSTRVVAGAITLGATAATENQYQEGFLAVMLGGGVGTYYRIREHSLGTSAGSDIEVILYDPIQVASDATTTVTFVKNPFHNPVLSAVTEIDTIIGVPNVAVTTGATNPVGFWVQVAGVCPTFVDGTPAVGSAMVRSTAVQGNLEVNAAAKIGQNIGTMGTVGINGQVQIVNLAIPGFW